MAKGFTESTVEEIKARVDLAELISSYGVSVKTAGATQKACCPFHHEKTPSFAINSTRGFYHCFGCGESGDAISFVQKMDGLTFVEAVKKLAELCGVKIETTEDPSAVQRKRLLALLAEIALFYRQCLLKTKEGEIARSYLVQRNLNKQVQDDYLIGYAPNGVAAILKWGEKHGYSAAELEAAGIIKASTRSGDLGYHRFGGRLMFSIKDKQGRVVGFSGRQLVASKNSGKYVNSPETLVFKKSNVLYGFDKAAGAIAKTANREAIVCEGQIDCIRLQIGGFPNTVAGQGTAFTEEHVKMLKKVSDQVALVYDDDGAGHKATVKSARLCLASGLPVRVVSLPNGEDPDSFLRTRSADAFRRLLDAANSIMAFQVRIERAKEQSPDSIDAVNRISKEILFTIAQCPNAVLRASMIAEAAKLLKIPLVALEEELSKLKLNTQAPTRTKPSDERDIIVYQEKKEAVANLSYEGEAASDVLPPPSRELDLCAFLLANEYDKELDSLVAQYLPKKVFAHPFTVRFVETWRAEAVDGVDLMQEFAAKLSENEQKWLQNIHLTGNNTQSSAMSISEILQEMIRFLWADALKRMRGGLPANGGAETDLKILKLSMDIKHLTTMRWSAAEVVISDWIKHFSKSEVAEAKMI